MSIKEKVAYLKGLAEGLGIGSETKEEKVFTAIISTLEDMAFEIDELSENAIDLGEELDSLSDELSELEELIYDENYDDFGKLGLLDDDEDDEDDECDCGHCHGGDDEDYAFEVSCPACGAELMLDEADLLKGSINCTACGEELEFDFDDDDDDEDDED